MKKIERVKKMIKKAINDNYPIDYILDENDIEFGIRGCYDNDKSYIMTVVISNKEHHIFKKENGELRSISGDGTNSRRLNLGE